MSYNVDTNYACLLLCKHWPTLVVRGSYAQRLQSWNIMIDFTIAGIPCIGIIDWGLALRAGVEQRPIKITN